MGGKDKKKKNNSDLEADESTFLRRSEGTIGESRTRGYDSELNQIHNQIENNYAIYNYLCLAWMVINTVMLVLLYLKDGPMKIQWIVEIAYAYFVAILALVAKKLKTRLLARLSIIMIIIYIGYEFFVITIVGAWESEESFFSGFTSGVFSIKFFAFIVPPIFLLFAVISLQQLLKKRDSIVLLRSY